MSTDQRHEDGDGPFSAVGCLDSDILSQIFLADRFSLVSFLLLAGVFILFRIVLGSFERSTTLLSFPLAQVGVKPPRFCPQPN